MTTNEFERDLDDQAGLKRPGRIDLRVFQNTPDAGDGHPGVQRCFRNYLHEGGIEKDIQLLGFSILGDSVDINNAELQQLSLIGGTTISAPQWVFVGEADQSVKQADSPTFNGLTLTSLTVNGAITITGNVDGVDVSDLKTAFDNHKANDGSDHSYIDQSVKQTDSPTFVGLTLSADLVTTSTVDGVDVSTHVHSGANQGGTISHASLSNRDGDNNYLHSTSAEQINWNDAHSHISANGTSHIYINQNVTTTGTPSFTSVNTSTITGTSVSITGSNGSVSLISKQSILFTPDSDYSTKRWSFMSDSGDPLLNANLQSEVGKIGYGLSDVSYPLLKIKSKEMWDDDGSLGEYSEVDDLQLIRNVKKYKVKKKRKLFDKEVEYEVLDANTLPWRVANNVLYDSDKDKGDSCYTNTNDRIGFILCGLQKLLERQDKLISELNDLGISINF